MHSPLVVLGGGPGGYAAAFLAADLGMEVALVEQEARLGGVCLLAGCIPSKALLHVAKVIGETRELAEWGVTWSAPAVSIDALRARKEKLIQSLASGLKQLAKRRKVKVIQARATFANSRTLHLQAADPGTPVEPHLTFDHCILATGSRPAIPPALDINSPRVVDSTGALALADVPTRLLVVGGGYIGLEMGTVYAALGSQVTVVELTDGLLPGADRDLVKPLHERLRKSLADIRLGTKVVGLRDLGEEVEVRLAGPDGESAVRYDRVLVSVGRRPNSTGIGLENTKVQLDDRGFACTDERQRTNDTAILAIGDVAGEPMLAHKAAHQGKAAVEALHGAPAVFAPQAIPAVVFTDPEIAWAGLTEDGAAAEGREITVARFPWAASGRAQSVNRGEGMTKLVLDPATERVLGVGIVGAGAGELIAEGVLGIEMGATARDMAETIHPHPTLSETLGFAAEVQLGMATEIYKPRTARPERAAR
jgi:dihydrolipoamide dehydrogenase